MTDNDATEATDLGDGVSARFDGYHIVLDAENEEGFNRIYLDINVMNSLNWYARKCYGLDEADDS